MLVPQIVEETPHYLLLHKPAGWLSERHPQNPQSLEAWVTDYLLQQKLARLPIDRPRTHAPKIPFVGVVHRLDRVTSGLLVFAKKKSTLRLLNEQWRNRQVQKTYLAIVSQAPPKSQARLEQHLLKLQQKRRAQIIERPCTGSRPAALSYRHLGQDAMGHWLEVQLHTGRFHQIRAQLAHLGCPILGDVHYGGQPLVTAGIALHAWRLAWTHPHEQTPLLHEAPLPEEVHWSGLKQHLARST